MGWFDQQKQGAGDPAGTSRPQGGGAGGKGPDGGLPNSQPNMPKRAWLTFLVVLLS